MQFATLNVIQEADNKMEKKTKDSQIAGYQQPDEELPFLKVGTAATATLVESEPFIRLTARGYAPCLRVKVLKNDLTYALIISSKSISEALEPLRKKNSGFSGLRLEICKKSEEQMSPYVIKELGKKL